MNRYVWDFRYVFECRKNEAFFFLTHILSSRDTSVLRDLRVG